MKFLILVMSVFLLVVSDFSFSNTQSFVNTKNQEEAIFGSVKKKVDIIYTINVSNTRLVGQVFALISVTL